MRKEFICKIDHATFNTEDALIKYILEKYTMSQEKGQQKSELLKQLQEAFPTADIDISNGHYERKDSPFIKIYIPEYNADFEFRIVKDLNDQDFFGEILYESVDEAISKYTSMLVHTDKLIEAINDKFNPDNIEINQIHEGVPYGDDCNSVSFSMTVNDQEYHFTYEFNGIDKCIRFIEGKFIHKVEGDCFADYGSYNSSETIYVDGVDLRDLAYRAKRLRVEILEEK